MTVFKDSRVLPNDVSRMYCKSSIFPTFTYSPVKNVMQQRNAMIISNANRVYTYFPLCLNTLCSGKQFFWIYLIFSLLQLCTIRFTMELFVTLELFLRNEILLRY